MTCWPIFDPIWPIFKLGLDIAKTNILTKFHQNQVTNVASIVKQGFRKIWPGDLVFNPTWPIFELILDIAKTNILIKFHQIWDANLSWWPSFWTDITNIQTSSRYCQNIHTFWPRFINIQSQMWPLECRQEFYKIWQHTSLCIMHLSIIKVP